MSSTKFLEGMQNPELKEKRKQLMINKWKDPVFRSKWSERMSGRNSPRYGHPAAPARKVIYTKPDGSRMVLRSTYEALMASHLDKNNKQWVYEPGPAFPVSYVSHTGTKKQGTYTPDFYVIDDDEFVEVKGWWQHPDGKLKFDAFRMQYPELKVKLIMGDDITKLGFNLKDKSYKILENNNIDATITPLRVLRSKKYPFVTKEFLSDHYIEQNKTLTQIERELDIPHRNLWRYARDFGIVVRTIPTIDKNRVIGLYTNKNMSSYQIAKIMNVSPSTIWSILKKEGHSKSVSESNKSRRLNLDETKLLELYINHKNSISKIAEMLNCSRNAIHKRLIELGCNRSKSDGSKLNWIDNPGRREALGKRMMELGDKHPARNQGNRLRSHIRMIEKNPMRDPETRLKVANTLKKKYTSGELIPWALGKKLPNKTGDNNSMFGKKD